LMCCNFDVVVNAVKHVLLRSPLLCKLNKVNLLCTEVNVTK